MQNNPQNQMCMVGVCSQAASAVACQGVAGMSAILPLGLSGLLGELIHEVNDYIVHLPFSVWAV